ncbi:antiviral reverse transcriptase Drt3a [Marinobacter apostichopi]|uniref:antiviral reverse transcriptase Drt3a n=1 Tax=Marinobacter apostichopi TaxID=3035454 RepID=UPI0025741DD0|nr:antiviral reverse transcriptase Drt3a [Marinobacter sp. LA51]
MLDQTFSAKSLHRLCSVSEVVEHKLGSTPEQQLSSLSKIAEKINSDSFEFSDFKSFQRNGKLVFKPRKPEDHFAIKKINQNLKKILGVRHTDRNTLVNQVKTLLEEKSPFILIKIDIASFYESISSKDLISACWDDPLLSYKTKVLLNDLLTGSQFVSKPGLPRGLSISSTLSEFYLSNLDEYIKGLEGVYYSARYVDDILVFSVPNQNDIMKNVETSIIDMGLEVNYKKCDAFQNKIGPKPIDFDYLGYRFQKTGESVEIDISPKKVKKIKSRIAKSFYAFSKDRDFDLLTKRLKFLTGNFNLKSRSKVIGNDLKTGTYYNYSEIPEQSDALKDLDGFILRFIYARRGKLGRTLSSVLNGQDKRYLRKFSFCTGFRERISHKFTYDDVVEIRKCWTNG